MSEFTRRRLLAIGGAVTAGGMAGCSGSGDEPAETTAETSVDGPVLEAISLENLHDSAHTLDIIIQWNDQIEYWTTHELTANNATEGGQSSLVVDREWPTDPGEFQLIVRLDTETRARFSSTQLPDRDCLDLLVMVTREGQLTILTDVSGGACSAETTATDAASTTDETDE
jgi:hypothetical protein